MKLAFSIICEHPGRKTGLTSLFHEFISHALPLFPDIDWIVFAGPNQEWTIDSPRVEVVRRFPASDYLARRLLADHFLVPPLARRMGAAALFTVGFVPIRKPLPVAMHLLSLQHLNPTNRVGWMRSLYRRLIVNRSVDRADRLIVNSQTSAEQVRRAFPGCAPRLTVSPEGMQHDQFHPDAPAGEAAAVREKFGVDPGYLLWVSNFYPYKQADLLLAAYARLTPEERAARPLVMVGGGWYGGMDAARERTAELGVGGDVHFLGWIDDAWLAPLYRQARGFVLASREETFGRCVVESMASGTPCVVNDLPIMHEVTGGHALIVDFQNTEAAARSLRTLLTDDARHDRLRADGLEWARQFDFDRLVTERVTAVLETLTKSAAPAPNPHAGANGG